MAEEPPPSLPRATASGSNPRLPPEIRGQITDYLNPRIVALAAELVGHILSPKPEELVCHARVWSSVFKPGIDSMEVLNDAAKYSRDGPPAADLVLVGSDLESLYYAKKRPSGSHLLLQAVSRLGEVMIPDIIKLSRHLRPYRNIGNNIMFIESSNIYLHCTHTLKAPDLWKFGVRQTCILYNKKDLHLRTAGIDLQPGEVFVWRPKYSVEPGFICKIPFKYCDSVPYIVTLEGIIPSPMEEFVKDIHQYLLRIQINDLSSTPIIFS